MPLRQPRSAIRAFAGVPSSAITRIAIMLSQVFEGTGWGANPIDDASRLARSISSGDRRMWHPGTSADSPLGIGWRGRFETNIAFPPFRDYSRILSDPKVGLGSAS